jgi:hypothetical protein
MACGPSLGSTFALSVAETVGFEIVVMVEVSGDYRDTLFLNYLWRLRISLF